jgi:hypothetical protein
MWHPDVNHDKPHRGDTLGSLQDGPLRGEPTICAVDLLSYRVNEKLLHFEWVYILAIAEDPDRSPKKGVPVSPSPNANSMDNS